MEYMPMGDLDKLLADHPLGLDLSLALKLGSDVAKGLKYLHEHNIIHRDLKPGNILLALEGPTLKAKIAGKKKTTTVLLSWVYMFHHRNAVVERTNDHRSSVLAPLLPR
jgi:serine/threonine protein kinase